MNFRWGYILDKQNSLWWSNGLFFQTIFPGSYTRIYWKHSQTFANMQACVWLHIWIVREKLDQYNKLFINTKLYFYQKKISTVFCITTNAQNGDHFDQYFCKLFSETKVLPLISLALSTNAAMFLFIMFIGVVTDVSKTKFVKWPHRKSLQTSSYATSLTSVVHHLFLTTALIDK